MQILHPQHYESFAVFDGGQFAYRTYANDVMYDAALFYEGRAVRPEWCKPSAPMGQI